MHACMLSCFSRVRLCVTLWTAAHQAPLSTQFSRQEYWSGLPFPSLANSIDAEKALIRFNIHLCIYHFWLTYFNWRIITLQFCGDFCHTSTWISHGCTGPPYLEPLPQHLPSHPISLGCPRALVLSVLLYASNMQCSSSFTCFSAIGNIHDSTLFSQVIPPSPSPT